MLAKNTHVNSTWDNISTFPTTALSLYYEPMGKAALLLATEDIPPPSAVPHLPQPFAQMHQPLDFACTPQAKTIRRGPKVISFVLGHSGNCMTFAQLHSAVVPHLHGIHQMNVFALPSYFTDAGPDWMKPSQPPSQDQCVWSTQSLLTTFHV